MFKIVTHLRKLSQK